MEPDEFFQVLCEHKSILEKHLGILSSNDDGLQRAYRFLYCSETHLSKSTQTRYAHLGALSRSEAIHEISKTLFSSLHLCL